MLHFVTYLIRNGNRMRKLIKYVETLRQPMIQSGGREESL
jgi:hypothetical protein